MLKDISKFCLIILFGLYLVGSLVSNAQALSIDGLIKAYFMAIQQEDMSAIEKIMPSLDDKGRKFYLATFKALDQRLVNLSIEKKRVYTDRSAVFVKVQMEVEDLQGHSFVSERDLVFLLEKNGQWKIRRIMSGVTYDLAIKNFFMQVP